MPILCYEELSMVLGNRQVLMPMLCYEELSMVLGNIQALVPMLCYEELSMVLGTIGRHWYSLKTHLHLGNFTITIVRVRLVPSQE